MKKLLSIGLTFVFVVTLFSVVPVVSAVEPTWNNAFVQKLISEKPLGNGQIYVGYDKQDITPTPIYKTADGSAKRKALAEEFGMPESEIVDGFTGIPMGGYGLEADRIAIVGGTGNSNAEYNTVNIEQAIYSIATAMMDSNGNIILSVVNDMLNSERYSYLKTAISKGTGVPEDHIMISGTHTHSSPIASTSSPKVKGILADYNAYFEAQATLACQNAIKDLAPATMSKKSVDIIDGTKKANFVRNYDTADDQYDYTGHKVAEGNNHGDFYWNTSSLGWKGVSLQGHITDADYQMQLLRFVRNDSKNILLCNFQGHPLRLSNGNSKIVSSDVIGAFRDALAYSNTTTGYRVAYYNGAGGNINFSTSMQSEANSMWTVTVKAGKFYLHTTKDTATDKYININYGFKFSPIGDLSLSSLTPVTSGKTNYGITVRDLGRIANYYVGNFMADCVINNFGTGWETLNASTVKAKEYIYSAPYHEPENETTTQTAKYISMLWNATTTGLCKMIYGDYNFTADQIASFSVIKDTASADLKTNIANRRAAAGLPALSDADLQLVANFVQRTQEVIVGNRRIDAVSQYYASSNNTIALRRTAINDYQKLYQCVSTGDVLNAKRNLANKLGRVANYYENLSTNPEVSVINSVYHSGAVSSTRPNNVGKFYTVRFTIFSIGDVTFASLPGELFDTNGKFIKENTSSKMTFVMGYSNGSVGYFPSAFCHLYGSYESDTTPTSAGDAEMFAGILSDFIGDLTFDGECYNIPSGGTKQLQKANGNSLYSYTDSFDYATYGAKYGDNNLERFSYSNQSVEWKSSDTNVATVDSTGKITAVGTGVATISVVHTGGNSVGKTFTNSASCTVIVGDTHTHCSECGLVSCTNGTHKKYEYTKWTSTTSLPTEAGHYYLNSDVTVTSPASISEDVVICLNGRTIKSRAKGAFEVKSGGSLTIVDCSGKGTVKPQSGYESLTSTYGLVSVRSGGKFNMVSGMLDASAATNSSGLALYVSDGGTANIKGGAVVGGTASSYGGAVVNLGTLNISGGTIEGGTAQYGGAVYSANTFNMTGGVISGGSVGGVTSSMGGVIFIAGTDNEMTGGTIQGGEAPYGGTLSLDSDSKFTLNGGDIGGGIASSKGGSIYLCSNSEFNLKSGTIRDGSTVSGNTAASLGGNICLASAGAVFNMSGGTIENGECYGFGGNVYIVAGATFNMKNGTVKGGEAISDSAITANDKGGHGGNFQVNGTLNLSGGTITEGMATGNGGGNISLYTSSAKVNMTGGTIKNGSATYDRRGNVYLWYQAAENAFDMSGGSITDDSSFCRVPGYYGGGVYIAKSDSQISTTTLKVSGTAKINGNHYMQTYDAVNAKNIYTDCNVYIASGKSITVGELAQTSKIGITMQDVTGTFSVGGASYRYAFSSDVSGYYVVKDNENLALSSEPDATPDTLPAREGAPSDIPLETPDVIRDGFDHYDIPAVGGTLDLSTYYSGITSVSQLTNGMSVTVSGTVATGKFANSSEMFLVNHSGGSTTVVIAVGHYHCLECGAFGCTIHSNVAFTGSASMPTGTITGNYFLTDDCTVTSIINVSSSRNINLCLNGHTVTGTSDIAKIFYTVGNLSITDCSAPTADNGNGKIVSNSTMTSGGGLLSINANSTVKLFRGTLDASNNVATNSNSNGAAIYSEGKLYINGGKIIGGNPKSCGGALYTYNTTYTEMNGGVIDCFNVVCHYSSVFELQGKATFVMNNGRIIGGRTTKDGAIHLVGSSGKQPVMTMNGGIIQDGMSYSTVTYNSDGSIASATTADTGNICLPGNNAKFTMNGGIIANGVAYGYAGNVNICSGTTMEMNGGTIMGGKALMPFGKAKTSIVGGNIRAAGVFKLSGGLITDGFCEGNYGANIVINYSGSEVTMTGGTVKNGISASSAGSNVGVWYHAGSEDNTKIAFDMSGGLITDDEDLFVPTGYHAGGLAIIRNGNGYYCNSTRLSGTAKICGNLETDVYIEDNHNDGLGEARIVIGDFSEGADITIAMSNEKIIATNVSPANAKYVHMTPANQNYVVLYDENEQTLSVKYQNKNLANQFIANYLTAPDGSYFTEATQQNFFFMKQSGALLAWNEQTAENKKIINAVYNELCGVNDIGALLAAAEEMEPEEEIEPYITFVADYLTDPLGQYINSVSIYNYQTFIDCKDAYLALDLEQRGKADALIGKSISELIASAEAIQVDDIAARAFLNNNFTSASGSYYNITDVSYDNCATIAAARTAWNALSATAQTYAKSILGINIGYVISTAESMLTVKTAGDNFLENNFKSGSSYYTAVNYSNCEAIKNAETAWGTLSTDAKTYAESKVGKDIDTMISTAKTMYADKTAAENFLNNNFKSGGYYTTVTYDNCEAIKNAETAWGTLSTDAKTYAENKIGRDIDTMISTAKTMYADKTAAENFLNNSFKSQSGAYYSEVTFENCEAIKNAETAWSALSSNAMSRASAVADVDISNLISTAKTKYQNKQKADWFISSKLKDENENLITDVTITNYRYINENVLVLDYESEWRGFDAETQAYAQAAFEDMGGNFELGTLATKVQNYYDIFKVNRKLSADGKKYTFYAGLDSNVEDYAKAGFEIEYNYTRYTKTTVSVDGYCTNEEIAERKLNDISAADYIYACDMYINRRDYGATARIRSFIELADGTKVYGEWENITINSPVPMGNITPHEETEIGNTTNYKDEDFFKTEE